MATDPVPLHQTIKFGEDFDFEFDLDAFQLRRGDRVLKLEPTPMELLLLLIEHKGKLVTREQITERIWGEKVFVDTDNGINGAIRKIRLTLRDDSEKPRFIQTVPGKGYRFIATIEDRPLQTPLIQFLPSTPPDPPLPETVETNHTKRSFLRFLVPAAVLLVALVAVFGWLHWKNRIRPVSSDARLMLAVLPFQNLTGDTSQDYFSDGLTEEMIAQLGRLDPKHLGVIARTSVMHYREAQLPIDQIARDLGVQYVLEGSVRRDAGRVRITTHLIQTRDQTDLWSRQYDRESESLLTLQGEIAQEIADQIQLTLSPAKRSTLGRPATVESYAAYDLYLKGRYFYNKRTVEGFHQAIEYFSQAIATDPNYARAYAGLADTYALLGGYSMKPQKEYIEKARAAALKALQLDNSLPEAHTSLAVIAQNYDLDWPTAEEEYRRAIQLDSNYATAHHWYAEFLSYQGRFDESFAEIERARQIDPLSLIIAADKGAILFYSRQYPQSIAQLKSVLEMEPNFPRARIIIFPCMQERMYPWVQTQLEKWPEDPWMVMMKTYMYSKTGHSARAASELHRLAKQTQDDHLDPAPLATAYAVVGDKQHAFFWMEKAYQQRSTALSTLKVNPLYDSLRDDPRFRDLLHRVKLD